MSFAAGIVGFLSLWGMIGAGVAAVFLTIGIDRIDEDARGAYVFRVLLIPGVMVIWPLVLWRWAILESGRDRWQRRYAPPRRSHGIVAYALLAGICAVIVLGLNARQNWPAEIAPQRLSAVEAAQ